MKRFAGRGIMCMVLTCLIFGGAQASTPVIWEQSNQRQFQNGEPVNISIASRGYLRLAPSVDPFFETSEPWVWGLATDSRGNIYAGNYKIDRSGHGVSVFDPGEYVIRSVVIDASDHVFAATLPGGKIYRLTPDGQSAVYFDPKHIISKQDSTATIWSLALDPEGNLYAGTGGGRGLIYKIDRTGTASVLAETEESHVVSLAVDPAGNLIAGTDPNGRIYRISPEGQLSVLYDSPYQEINTILIDASGTIYAGAVDGPRRVQGRGVQQSPPPPAVTPGTAESSATVDVGVFEVTASPSRASQTGSFRPPRSTGGVVYQIRPDGVVQEWWRSREDACFALAFHEDGTLLIGTGPRGVVYAVSDRGRSTILTQLQDSQITAFARTPDNQIVVASSNLGNIYRMGRAPVREGTFESEVKDTEGASSWGRIRWTGQMPSGTTVRFYTRTGNTDTPDKTWSNWTGPYTDREGETITSPDARFIQWKAVLATKNTETPMISSVSVAYLTRNVAPTVNNVTVYEPGIYLRDTSSGDTQVQDLPPKVAEQTGGNRSGGGRNRQSSAGIPAYRKGMRAVAIDADDANHDDMTYAVYFRGQNETQWKLLRDDLQEGAYSWDSETLPDGLYAIRVVVSDAPSNPPNLALKAELESEPFLIDNMAPQVTRIETTRRNPRMTLTFTVEDAASPLYKTEYAIDGGNWWVIYPDDGVSDSMVEAFTLTLGDLGAGEHTIAIRTKDISNNVGTGKRVITIPE